MRFIASAVLLAAVAHSAAAQADPFAALGESIDRLRRSERAPIDLSACPYPKPTAEGVSPDTQVEVRAEVSDSGELSAVEPVDAQRYATDTVFRRAADLGRWLVRCNFALVPPCDTCDWQRLSPITLIVRPAAAY